MRLWLVWLFGGVAALAQAPIAVVVPGHSTPVNQTPLAGRAVRANAAGAPFLGFVLGPDALELRAILGTTSTAHLSDPLRVPEAATRLYLPPRQHYALIEQDGPLAVWRLGNAAPSIASEVLTPITGTMSHPDVVAFSPRGEAAVVYSRTNNRLQVIDWLPAKPSIASEVMTTQIGDVSKLALSDDAKTVVALSANSNLVSFFSAGVWRPMPGAYEPAAWSFVSRTHDLVLTDLVQNMVVLLSGLGETAPVIRILAQGIRPDLLTVTKSGESVILADSTSGTVWAAETKTMTLRQLSSGAHVDSLSLLRDGHAALLSVSPTLSVFQFPPVSGY